MSDLLIRAASTADASSIRTIYAPVVERTIISFEEVAPTVDEMAERIETISRNYPYLIAEKGGVVVGYAYASQHRTRAAYRSSVDVTVYIATGVQRSGIGRALYAKLLPSLAAHGFHAAFAGIALPNPGSIALHERMGFTPIGVYREVGFKFDTWHDVGWWQCLL